MRRTLTLSLALVPLVLVLGWAAAGAALAGGGCHQVDEAVATEGTATAVKIDGCTFAPTVTRVPVGAEVRFLNTSLTSHDVTGRSHSWGSDNLPSGATYSARFGVAGVYAYSCSLHPGMAGVVIVGPPDAVLADNVQAAPVEVRPAPTSPEPAAATSGDATLPILAAGGLGLLVGALVTGVIATRRQRT